MPALTNPRWERFCHEYIARPDNATEAYKAAGYAAQGNGAEVNACRLLQRPEVVARIRELQAGAAAQAQVTVAGLIAEAEAARALAQKLGQPGAMVTAIVAKAKLSGLWVERSDRTIRRDDVSQMSDAELEHIVRQGETSH